MKGRYEVSGVALRYEDFGPALSRSQTEALKRTEPDTIYVVKDGLIVGSSERDSRGHVQTRQFSPKGER